MPSHLSDVPTPEFNLDFTIEEIQSQLNALGITDLSETQLARLKCKLDGVIHRERANLTVHRKRTQPENGNDNILPASPPLSEDSSTTPVFSPKTVSPVVTQDDLADVNHMWYANVPPEGARINSPDSSTFNSNSTKLMSSSSHLLTVPPRVTSHRLRRLADRSPSPSKDSTISSSSPQMEEPADSHSPFEVITPSTVQATPRIQLSIQKPSDATESSAQEPRPHMTSSLVPKVVLPTTNSNPLPPPERRLGHGIRDLGDFASSQSGSPHVEDLKLKPTVRTTGPERRMLHHSPLTVRKMSSSKSSQPTMTTTRTSSSWDSTNSVSRRSNMSSVLCPPDTAVSVHHQQHTRSINFQQAGLSAPRSGTVSNPVHRNATHCPKPELNRNSDATTLHGDHSRTLLSSAANSQAPLNLSIPAPNLVPEEQLQPQSSRFDSHLDRIGFGQESRRLHVTNPRPSAATKSILSQSHSGAPRPNRFITQTGLHTRSDWPRRSVLKTQSTTSFATSTSTMTNTTRTRDGAKIESTPDQSGSRSARFPENPVSKVHNLHVRPHTVNYMVPRAESQTPRSSLSSHSHRSSVSSISLPRRQDPVARYRSYQRSWLANLVPGEDARRILRWNVKTAMMHREVPVLQRNLAEVTQLFGPRAAAMLARARQRKLKELNLGYAQSTSRHSAHGRCRIRGVLNESLDASGSSRSLLRSS